MTDRGASRMERAIGHCIRALPRDRERERSVHRTERAIGAPHRESDRDREREGEQPTTRTQRYGWWGVLRGAKDNSR